MTTPRAAPLPREEEGATGSPESGCCRAALERIEQALRGPVRLVWTDNRAVYLSFRRGSRSAGRPATVRLHRSFRDAPEPVWEALTAFLSTGSRHSLTAARRHFQAWQAAQGQVAPHLGRRPPLPQTEGDFHRLDGILAEVRAAGGSLFEGLPPVVISWGPVRRPGRRALRLGSYRAAGQGTPAVIRVHRVLDHRRVPRAVVAHVLHHELVHHRLACLASPREGRLHGPEFRRLERLFPHHGEAMAWLRNGVPRLGRR